MDFTKDQKIDAFEIALLARNIEESQLMKVFYMLKGLELAQSRKIC